MNILRQSAEGKQFTRSYQKLKLNDGLRTKLVLMILHETFSKGMVLSRPCLKDMAKQICKIFTKEKEKEKEVK